MATAWVITTAAERFPLDARNHGEITLTVTNPGPAADRAVLEAVPGDGADPSWFSIDEPQRLVPAGGSVTYVVNTTVPPGAPAGSRSVQGRVYSADTAPEERSVLSNRIAFDIKPMAQKPRRPWWPYAVAGGIVIVVLLVVGFLILRPRGVSVPDVTNRPLAEAEQILTNGGLTLGKVSRVTDPAQQNGMVVAQDPAGGTAARDERTVDLTVVANPEPRVTIRVAVKGSGSATGGAIVCPGRCTATADVGSDFSLAALARPGNIFAGWGGSCSGTAPTCRFAVPAGGASVTAAFTAIPTSPPTPDPTPVVPDVRGLPRATAQAVLQAAGFSVRQADVVDRLCNHLGEVVTQNPAGNRREPRGSLVTISIGTPPPRPKVCP